MPVDFLASAKAYRQHLDPIWDGLPDSLRGVYHRPHERDRRPIGGTAPTVVASYGDSQRCPGRPLALVNHGAGQTYGNGTNPAYVGGLGSVQTPRRRVVYRDRFSLFLEPSERCAELNRAASPEVRNVVVGTPAYLDRWLPPVPWVCPAEPIVAVSFHSNLDARELGMFGRNCWDRMLPAFSDLASRWKVLGHLHPRQWTHDAVRTYQAHGIEPVQDWLEVLERADLYCIDNSSTGPEFMATGRPVVWMSRPEWRREPIPGGRFWEWSDGMPQTEQPGDLAGLIAEALTDPPCWRHRREDVAGEVYALRDGRSTERAVDALVAWHERVT